MTARLPLRPAALLAALALLAACASGRDLGDMRPELGDFRLSHNIVVDANAQQGPLSRPAEPGAWKAAIEAEVARRLGRYEGDRLYHVAVHVDAYILAVPGVPLVASPRSALIISVNVWDDALGRPLNERVRQFTVLESLSGESVVGSGLTQTAEQQMTNLARNAALQIESWLAENPQWFDPARRGEPAPDRAAGASADNR
ncbi:hypothetical protein [Pararhodobacter sp. SW119]|uniref:hypothetical protein n=1 Tax=Pararhodobacter sp. SW119 TaxID=2780075 RepID=UPI001AE0C574|nr:hypothetical protein [Pararhodobacter sp. SW119]